MNYSRHTKKRVNIAIVSWVVIFIIGLIVGMTINRVFANEIKPVNVMKIQRYEINIPKPIHEEQEETEQTSLGEYTITAYCGCEECCGKWALNRPEGIVYGASGIELIEGVSVASPLPLGTEIIIDGQTYINQDRTAEWIAEKYNDKIIDIYFEDHEKAIEFGKQIHEVHIKN